MSVVIGRVVLSILGAAAVGALLWAEIGALGALAHGSAEVLPVALGAVVVIVWVLAASLMARFVEATVDACSITIRRVLGPRRRIGRPDVDEVVVLTLILPTCSPAESALRIVLRRGGRTITAFTPRDASTVGDLDRLGWGAVAVSDPLTPPQAARRFETAVSSAERLVHHLPVVAVVVGVGVAAWFTYDALQR